MLADFDVSTDLEGSQDFQIPVTNFAGTNKFFSSDVKVGTTLKSYSFPLDVQVLGYVAHRLCNCFTGKEEIL